MNRNAPDTDHDPETTMDRESLPKPRIEKSRWPYLLIWIVPILALVAGGYYIHRISEQNGPEIRVTFADATGLRIGQTPVTVRGVRVGTVSGITLSDDQKHAVVHLQLQKSTAFVARTDSKFWIVRPDVSGGVLSGISTVTTGPYIEVLPGAGDMTYDFSGLDHRPLLIGQGIRVVLHADRLKHLQLNSPVLYRGLQVGTVQDIRFSDDATQVNATLFIWQRYAMLVRANSKFWAVGGTDVKGGLFSGIQLQIDSLRTLIAGGVAFATPEKDSGEEAVNGQEFTLHDDPKEEWLTWAPKFQFPASEMPSRGKDTADLAQESGLRAAERVR